MTQVLHFALGPVQGFIAEARRTRDLWAGSFILSLLSAHAMLAIKANGGEITFPEVEEDELFSALSGGNASPYVGSLPNRFKADVSTVASNPGEICKQAVMSAWTSLAQTVWEQVVKEQAPLSAKNGQAAWEIWQRQVVSFWDMNWVFGNDPRDGSDSAWLDLRKNWRTHNIHRGAAEGGDHCRMMGDFQEISGFDRVREKDAQTAFWTGMCEAQGNTLDLQKDERLCAIALIKRFFPVLASKNGHGIQGALPFVPGGKDVDIRHWPSTSYIAALPWLKAARNLNEEDLNRLPAACRLEFGGSFLAELRSSRLFKFPQREKLFSLDGHLLHEDGIKTYVKEAVKTGAISEVQAASATKKITKALRETGYKIGKDNTRLASEFYAVICMDGDEIGKRLKTDQTLIKKALPIFTERAKTLLQPGNPYLGTLVYAGGDDVLALLPVDTAIHAALDLRVAYDAAFDEARNSAPHSGAEFTLSGSIVYSHFKNPLSSVLRQSHYFLDTVAKDGNGRNSLAIAVLKPGGVAAEWVTTFDGPTGRIATLEQLGAARLGRTGTSRLSGGFFHGFQQKYRKLFTLNQEDADTTVSVDDMLTPLLMREIRRAFGGANAAEINIGELTTKVENILRPQENTENTTRIKRGVAFGGGLVARFLSKEGRQDLISEGESAP